MESLASMASSPLAAFRPDAELEVIGDKDLLSRLPDEILQQILGYLSPNELLRNCLVSKKWNRLSSDPFFWGPRFLTKTFCLLNVFDGVAWAKYFGDLSLMDISVEDEPPIKPSLIPVIKKFMTIFLVKSSFFMLLTIPKGFSLNTIVKHASQINTWNVIQYIKPEILEKFGSVTVEKTYRILITESVLLGSQFIPFHLQKNFAAKRGCERPRLLEAVAHLLSVFRISNGLSSANTCCEETIGDQQLHVLDENNMVGLSLNSIDCPIDKRNYMRGAVRIHDEIPGPELKKID